MTLNANLFVQGGSEIWNADSRTVIASLAFHPFERLLVIATYNEIHFWDWSKSQPFAVTATKTDKEKVRCVYFKSNCIIGYEIREIILQKTVPYVVKITDM